MGLPSELARVSAESDLARAKRIGEGWEASVWKIGSWTVRVPLTSADAVRIERQTHLYQSPLGLPLPRDARVVRNEDGTVVAGLYRYIESSKMRTAHGRAVARELGWFLARLHAVAVGVVKPYCVEVKHFWASRYEPLVERCRSHLSPRTRAWVERRAAYVPPESERVLIHGDLAPEHVFLTAEGRLSAIIDFLGPQIADPAVDFGALADRYGWAFATRALAAYHRPRDIHFEARARLYGDLRPLFAVAFGLERNDSERLSTGRRSLAARAAVATRNESV